ncbi:MAG TPA: DMT family transporter [Mycobacteriales bacterium]|nr:DMT family transporter [Mycobacteriales bacterium]
MTEQAAAARIARPAGFLEHRVLPVPAAVGLSLLGGGAAAAQAAINGRLGEGIGTPVTAALISNGLATVILIAATLRSQSIRAGLRRVRETGLPWWQYLGGALGAMSVAGAALASPVLGVALFTVVQVSGTSVGGIVTDRVGLSPKGRLPVSAIRCASAALAVTAVVIAQLGRPFGHIAIGMVCFVLAIGLTRPVQVALNGRLTTATGNVGSASLVNALIGTGALILAAPVFLVSGHLPFHHWPGQWWFYLGGVLALLVTGANLVSVHTIGVLRTSLAALAGQITGGLLLDAFVPGSVRPTGWLVLGAALTMTAALAAGLRPRARG